MKNEYLLIISFVLLFLSVHSVHAVENEFVEVQAWCNGEKATVNDIDVKIGEPITITVRVTSRIDGYVDIKLKEPWTTKSFEVISGPSISNYILDYEKRTNEVVPRAGTEMDIGKSLTHKTHLSHP